MGKQYTQMGIEERCEIARRRQAGETLRQIAASLDRAPSSIARELARNGAAAGYTPSYAQQQARARHWTGSKLLRDPTLQAEVLARLAAGARLRLGQRYQTLHSGYPFTNVPRRLTPVNKRDIGRRI